MIGSLLAGTDESPGDTVIYQGRTYKLHRGMGSIGALRKRSARNASDSTEDISKLVPRGIEGRVPHKGKLSNFVYQLVGGIRSAMGYCGAPDINALRTDSQFVRMSSSGYRESHPHDIDITEEAPNYTVAKLAT